MILTRIAALEARAIAERERLRAVDVILSMYDQERAAAPENLRPTVETTQNLSAGRSAIPANRQHDVSDADFVVVTRDD